MRDAMRVCAVAVLLLCAACGGDDDSGGSGSGSGAGNGGTGGSGGEGGSAGASGTGGVGGMSGTGGSGGNAGTSGSVDAGDDDAGMSGSGGMSGTGGSGGMSGTGGSGGDAGTGGVGGMSGTGGSGGTSGAGGSGGTSGAGGSGGTSGAGGSGVSDSLLGDEAASYTEANEQNPTTAPEQTSYVLDTNGLRIFGHFEAGTPTQDAYQFNTGSYGTPQGTQPGQPGVWVQVLIDGQRVGFDEGIFLSLDAVENDGYSSLTGGSFNNAGVTQFSEYRLNLTPLNASLSTLAGKDYVIEIRATFVGMP